MKNKIFNQITVEPTNRCNLRCPLCHTGNNYNKIKKGEMTIDQFKKIIEPIAHEISNIFLYNYGEPFLAKDIYKMIEYITRKNIFITIHTNALCIKREEFEKILINCSNIRMMIVFSIDGITQESYQSYRRGGNLKLAFDNLRWLTKLKKKHSLFNIKIVWQFLVMGTNEHEVEQLNQMGRELGVDMLRLKTVSVNKKNSLYKRFIPKDKKYRRIWSNSTNSQSPCYFLDPGNPVVLWNGDVVPCCNIKPNEYIMGNAFSDKLTDIWYNEKYQKFSREAAQNKSHICNSKCRVGAKIIFSKKIYYKQEHKVFLKS